MPKPFESRRKGCFGSLDESGHQGLAGSPPPHGGTADRFGFRRFETRTQVLNLFGIQTCDQLPRRGQITAALLPHRHQVQTRRHTRQGIVHSGLAGLQVDLECPGIDNGFTEKQTRQFMDLRGFKGLRRLAR